MKISAFLLVSLLQGTMPMAAGSGLKHRYLEDAYYDAAAAVVDDTAVVAEEAVDDLVEEEVVDDAIAANYSGTSVSYNATVVDRVKDYSASTYQSVPAEWTEGQWELFAALMFVFGIFSSLFSFFFIFPCCFPSVARTAYARMITEDCIEDPKKFKLIIK